MSLTDFKSNYLDRLLFFLWEQWAALGIAGYEGIKSNIVIDPEALLLFSFSICRYDSRLFDEIMDWLFKNGQYINVQRLSSLQEKYNFSSGPQISAAAEYLSQNSMYRLKWKRLSDLYIRKEPDNLFYTKMGKKIPVSGKIDPIFKKKGLYRNILKIRNYSKEFSQTSTASFLLRMRALFGINARSELMCLLMSVPQIHPSEAARLTGYFQKTIQTALLEMSHSGFVEIKKSGREKYYRLKKDFLISFSKGDISWINWSPLFKGLEIILEETITNDESSNLLVQSAELRRIMKEAGKYLNETGSTATITESGNYPGEEYIPVFFNDINNIFDNFYKGDI